MITHGDRLAIAGIVGGFVVLTVLLMGGAAWIVLLGFSYLAWGDQFLASYRWRQVRRHGLHLPPPGDDWI